VSCLCSCSGALGICVGLSLERDTADSTDAMPPPPHTHKVRFLLAFVCRNVATDV
jgi:hypothetical protein